MEQKYLVKLEFLKEKLMYEIINILSNLHRIGNGYIAWLAQGMINSP